jgi:hypothetical protein
VAWVISPAIFPKLTLYFAGSALAALEGAGEPAPIPSVCDAAWIPVATALVTSWALFFETVLWAIIPAITLIAPSALATIWPHGTGAARAIVEAMAPVNALASPSACVVGLLGTAIAAQAATIDIAASDTARVPHLKNRARIIQFLSMFKTPKTAAEHRSKEAARDFPPHRRMRVACN